MGKNKGRQGSFKGTSSSEAKGKQAEEEKPGGEPHEKNNIEELERIIKEPIFMISPYLGELPEYVVQYLIGPGGVGLHDGMDYFHGLDLLMTAESHIREQEYKENSTKGYADSLDEIYWKLEKTWSENL